MQTRFLLMLLSFQVRNTDTRPLLPSIRLSIPILVIHGTKDRIIHYAESNYLIRHIKHAQRIAIDPSGKVPGSVPSGAYGYSWYEYFEPRVWVNVAQTFTKGGCRGREGQIVICVACHEESPDCTWTRHGLEGCWAVNESSHTLLILSRGFQHHVKVTMKQNQGNLAAHEDCVR
ncbi:uncharacterized protein EI90DRAFT_2610737 [Cantharellus anzutake]|uniref:uncharacterized protein n=1 Tax=Cantharellus anzutake TaxID=1750568 RepID=UPI0019047ACE|nr:uncharacterized protein EI90DRAFT_2610737 [Cantharellus anzutake]KAF8320208.1 hypothetical protein EI90DRAFT_2610737 [Cantharellus anzutake]